MPHVLILPSWYPIDPSDIRGSFFREQAIALQKAGHKVGVIHPNLRSLLNRKRLLRFIFGYRFDNDTNVPTYQYHNLKWLQPFPSLEIKFELHLWKRLYQQYVELNGKPQVAHVHSMLNAGLFAKWLLEEEGIPYIITEHSSAYLRGRLRRRDIVNAQSIARDATKRFGVSNALCRRLSSDLGRDSGNWEEMPNPVDPHTFDPNGFPEKPKCEAFVFLCIAFLWKNKGIHFLLKAFADQFAGNLNVKLRIGGTGPQYNKLKRLARSLGIQSQVEFLGALSRRDVPKHLAQSDTFVLPSLYETFGVVLVEALMMGKPVVATQCGGPESIINSRNGRLVPPRDVAALSEALAAIHGNHGTFDPEIIREDAVNRFSIDVIVQNLSGIYEDTPGISNSKSA